MIIGIPRSDTCFDVSYDGRHHEIEVEIGGETFDPTGFFIDASPFGSLEAKIVPLGQYLLDKAYEQWLDEGGPQDLRDGDLEAAQDARDER